MMRQYQQIKQENPDFLLFYRMGDFFELFGDDALTAHSVLQVTLTQRRTKKEAEGIPMCGVPFHAAEQYIAKLLQNGYKVALCEQVETPEAARQRGGHKALVKREVTRLYTGGTLTEEALLAHDQAHHLTCLAEMGDKLALAWLDLSTGQVQVAATDAGILAADLARVAPKELLVTEALANTHADILASWPQSRPEGLFHLQLAQDTLKQAYEVESLQAFGFVNQAQQMACGVLLHYARQTQLGKLPVLQPPQIERQGSVLLLDSATRRHLEISQTFKGEKKGSLWYTVNRCVTAPGSRLLANWLAAPSADVVQIQQRQAAVETLAHDEAGRTAIRQLLKQTTDMARALSRISLLRAGPRDVATLRQTLQHLPALRAALDQLATTQPAAVLRGIQQALQGLDDLTALLQAALITDDVPLLAREGGYIAPGYCNQLDDYRALRQNFTEKLRAVEQQETQASGLPLKLKYNKVWGHFFEVTRQQAQQVPAHFIHRQTTTSTVRFVTEELMDLERRHAAAEANTLAREQALFQHICQQVAREGSSLLLTANALATLDVLAAGAELMQQQGCTLPTVDDSRMFEIEAGRHAVVAASVDRFIANDCALSDGQLWLLTGPNMAGKSTFLRQNALMVLLAQVGYPIPAKRGHIGVVDRLFTRIGASDDLAAGQSTFMVEMVETAHLLHNATPRSLVVLDEIGRGTATYDGLAIAWACVEHLAQTNRCRTLFATHYHELAVLADQLPTVSNHHVAVKDWHGDIVFLHEVRDGHAPHSYGLHVGKLAGLPQAVLQRASVVLESLEAPQTPAPDLPLFTAQVQQHPASPSNNDSGELEKRLMAIDLDTLSPREAQNLLYDLRVLAAMG